MYTFALFKQIEERPIHAVYTHWELPELGHQHSWQAYQHSYIY